MASPYYYYYGAPYAQAQPGQPGQQPAAPGAPPPRLRAPRGPPPSAGAAPGPAPPGVYPPQMMYPPAAGYGYPGAAAMMPGYHPGMGPMHHLPMAMGGYPGAQPPVLQPYPLHAQPPPPPPAAAPT